MYNNRTPLFTDMLQMRRFDEIDIAESLIEKLWLYNFRLRAI